MKPKYKSAVFTIDLCCDRYGVDYIFSVEVEAEKFGTGCDDNRISVLELKGVCLDTPSRTPLPIEPWMESFAHALAWHKSDEILARLEEEAK